MPKPGPKLGTKAFAELQAKWYKKLERSGFQDIEWADHDTGYGQNSRFLKGDAAAGLGTGNKHRDIEQFYRLVTNYLTHVPIKGTRMQFMCQLFGDGVTYRAIIKAVKKRFKVKISLYYVFYHMRKFKAAVMEFNKINPDGLLYEAPDPVLVTHEELWELEH